MASTPYFLDRPQLPANFGDLLRNAGLNEGVSYGGSEVDLPANFTPEQIAQALSLARGGGMPISNADAARFLSQTGGLPSLPVGGGGGDSGTTAAGGANPDGTAFDLSGVSMPAGSGRAVGSVLGGTAGALLGGMVPGAGVVLGPAGGLVGGRLGGNLGATIEGALRGGPGTLQTTENQIFPDAPAAVNPTTPEFTAHDLAVAGSLGITNAAEQGFAFNGGFVNINGNPMGRGGERQSLSPDDPTAPDGPTGPGPSGPFGDEGNLGTQGGPGQGAPGPTGDEGPGPGGPGPSGDPGDAGPSGSGPSGGEGGPGGGGPGGGGGDDGGGGDFARGGRVRHTQSKVGGSWKGAKKFQHGGPVMPMSERDQRLARIKSFEAQHGRSAI